MKTFTIIFLLLFIFIAPMSQAQEKVNDMQSEICLSVVCKELGFTMRFNSNEEMTKFLFSTLLLENDPGVETTKVYREMEVQTDYPTIDKYCQYLVVVKIEDNGFEKLVTEIKQKLSGL